MSQPERRQELDELLAPLSDDSEPVPRRPLNREQIVSRMVEVSLAPEPRFSQRARMGGGLALAATLALAAWGGSSWWRGHAGSRNGIEVVALRGQVTSVEGPLGVGKPVHLSATGTLETSKGAEARFTAPGGLSVELLEDTKVSLADLGGAQGSSALRLERGRVRCSIQHLPERQFVVVTPSARVVDVGTVFSVSVDPGRAGPTTLVHVEEGAVLVEHAGGQARLGAAQSWSSAAPAPAPAVEAAPPVDTLPEPLPSAHRDLAKHRPPTLAIETELLQNGLRSEQRGELQAAAKAFETLVARYPSSPLAPDAKLALSRVRSRLESAK
jgi:ferric-dicitrate binding protein FerR (iron transport regulator)